MITRDKDLLQLLSLKPEEGFRQLLRLYQEPIYWHIRRLVVDHQDAEDATQETFVRVFRSLEGFRGDSSLATWIYKIATSEGLRLIDRRREQHLGGDSAEMLLNQLSASEYVDYSDLEGIKLQRAILSLPTKQQLAFSLRYYDELEYDEIAQIMDTSPANVKANYHHAKTRIIAYMKSQD